MKLIIAEKPDQGAKLAAPFTHKKKNGYIEIASNPLFPEGAILTWAIGHLCELVPPESYDFKWKRWSLTTLPIIPDVFKHQVIKGKSKQFQIIKDFVKKTAINEIIIAGDAEREGEAIIRIILSLCQNKKPMKRLWISSLTAKSVINGFENLLDEEKTVPIYYEALSRACADWLVGMNASRVYTLLLQAKGISDVFSIGRVQTPTLALIVSREKEIQQFKSEPFWEVFAEFNVEGKKYQGKWHKDLNTRLQDEKQAKAIAKFCENKPAKVAKIEKEQKEFQAPFLFNLSSLQATANKAFKYSPKKTLDLAQKLYLKGIISYPRSDSNFVTKEEAALFPETLAKLSQFGPYQSYFPLPKLSILDDKRYVNEKKVTDHYAIIPTEQVADPSKLPAEEQKIYDLIVRRLIAAHYDQSIVSYTTIHTLVDNRAQFISKGKVQIQDGWRKVIFDDNQSKNEEEPILPNVSEMAEGLVEKTEVKESKTKPPKRYTEGQLITLMKTAGKFLEDRDLQSILNKTEGLGTEATRAGIITILKDRKYITVEKNQVSPTEKGMLLIDAIGENILVSPEMTAKWEQRLHEIGEGQASPKGFIDQAKRLTSKIIDDAKFQAEKWQFDGNQIGKINATAPKRKNASSPKTPIGKCLRCEGEIVDKGQFYGCTNYQKTKCDFTVSKKILGRTISQTNVKKLLKDGKTNLINGFKKNDKEFEASLIWDSQEQKVKFSFPSKKS